MSVNFDAAYLLKNKNKNICIQQGHQQELSAVFPDIPVLDSVGLLSRLCLLLWFLHTDGRRHHTHGQWTGVYLDDVLYGHVL